jgi:xanthine dehydrogenase accessory factor
MIYQTLADIERKNEPAVYCVVVHTSGSTPRHVGSKMVVYADGQVFGTIGGGEVEQRVKSEALQALQDGAPRFLEYQMTDPACGDPGICGGQLDIFVEPICPKPTLVVIGAGHVGKAVAWLAKGLGFRVAVSDDRSELCSPEALPEADEYYPVPITELPQHLKITPWTYLVLTTRSVDIDVLGLPALLDSSAAYIGVIGARRRWLTACQQLLDKGIPQEKLDRVHSPIGLKINAETPEEIAVSILAEIIQIRRKAQPEQIKESVKEV